MRQFVNSLGGKGGTVLKRAKVWAFMGQSNAGTSCEILSQPYTELSGYTDLQTNVYKASRWTEVATPLIQQQEFLVNNILNYKPPDVPPNNAVERGGLELKLFKDLADEGGYDVFLLHVGQGATGMAAGEDWNPSTGFLWGKFQDYWTAMQAYLTANNYTYTVEGTIWFQGEADQSNVNYATNFADGMQIIRNTFNDANHKIFVCGINKNDPSSSGRTYVSDIHIAWCAADANGYYMDNDNKTGMWWDLNNVHLKTEGSFLLADEIKTLYQSL